MGNGQPTEFQIREKWLDVAHMGFAGCRIPGMANGRVTMKSVNDAFPTKDIADQPDAAVRRELFAVERNDTGCLLSPMLQGV